VYRDAARPGRGRGRLQERECGHTFHETQPRWDYGEAAPPAPAPAMTEDVHGAHLALEPWNAARPSPGPGHEGPRGWDRRPTLLAEDFHEPHPTWENKEATRPGPGPSDDGPWEWEHGPTSRTEDAHGARPAWELWDAARPGPGHGFWGPRVWERGHTPLEEDTSGAHPPREYREAARPGPWPRPREATEREASPPVWGGTSGGSPTRPLSSTRAPLTPPPHATNLAMGPAPRPATGP